MTQQPIFRYHPNCYQNDVIIFAQGTCQVCQQVTDCYTDHMYSRAEVTCICLTCVANGRAAQALAGHFSQGAEAQIPDLEREAELFYRTPGYNSWQGEYWLTCCEDYCAFLGDVGTKELEALGIADQVLADYMALDNSYQNIRDDLVAKGWLAGYLFQCLHCHRYRLHVDAG